MSFNYNGEYCATMDMNGLILVWKTDTCKKVTEIQGPEEPEWMRFHPRVLIPLEKLIVGKLAARCWQRFQYLVLEDSGRTVAGSNRRFVG